MSKLTAKAIEKALPKNKEYKLSDGGGLYLRIRSSGAKSWLFLFRLNSVRHLHKMTIGSPEDLSLKEARAKLPELRKLVADGLDPRNVRAAIKANNAEAFTMQKLFNSWIEFSKLNNNFSNMWSKRHENRWNLHLKNHLGKLLVKDVDRAHLATALDSMVRQEIKEETRKALTTLNLMMDYALTRNFINQNPSRLLRPKDFSATANKPRKRALTLLELRQLWKALDQALLIKDGIASSSTMNLITATAIKLLILTGARRGEVVAMRWLELDFDSNTWHLESNRTKNRQPHTIYLSDLAIMLIKSLQPLNGNSLFVFDTGRSAEQDHIHLDSLNRAISRLQKNSVKKNILIGLKPFTLHDLRRSAATAWGEYLKTAPHVIERMLNHQPENKLVATYQRAVYVDEQKAAWCSWGQLVNDQIARDPDKALPDSDD
jgi:integrase